MTLTIIQTGEDSDLDQVGGNENYDVFEWNLYSEEQEDSVPSVHCSHLYRHLVGRVIEHHYSGSL